jgi:subtilisin family serine protease
MCKVNIEITIKGEFMKYEKLSASMSALMNEYHSQNLVGMLSFPRTVPLAGADSAGTPKVFVYIRCDSDAKLNELPGVKPHLSSGQVRTALVSLDAVDRLSESADVYFISPSRVLKPLNDVAATKTRLTTFRNQSNLRGNRVVIGVVDTGIDPTHPAFNGRIHSIWDQTISGTGWGTTNYGKVLQGATLVVGSDTHGHGTHVAGIAAADDAVFTGVAPEATLVIVKTNFANTSIGDGIRYVFHVADQLDCAAVVNLSLGGHFDPHDGSDDLCALIDQESGQGRIVVAAAGNEGGDDIHAQAGIAAGQSSDILFAVPPNSQAGATPLVVLNGWYDANSTCEIAIQTSSGDLTPFQSIIALGSPSRQYTFPNVLVTITTPPTAATSNGDHHFLVEIQPNGAANLIQGGTWRLKIRNSGLSPAQIDCWSLVPQGAREVTFLSPFQADSMKIGSPGAAREAITVASYTSRNNWADSTGASRAVGLTLDAISDFSSPGPLRDNSLKPDVTAPGAMIISCLSALATFPAGNIVNTQFGVNAGTSMASPFIAGLVALLLERNPLLDPAAVKALLKANSQVPGQLPGHFDPQWGFGLIDAGSL